jgi:hypothetical protein
VMMRAMWQNCVESKFIWVGNNHFSNKNGKWNKIIKTKIQKYDWNQYRGKREFEW